MHWLHPLLLCIICHTDDECPVHQVSIHGSEKLGIMGHYSIYRTLVKKGPWAVHLTLDLDWGVGRASLSQLDVKERPGKLRDLHNNRGYY